MMSIVMLCQVKRPGLQLGFVYAKVYQTYRTMFRVRIWL